MRETYSLLEFLGDIGGLYEFLYLFSSGFVKLLIQLKFVSLVAKQMYVWKQPKSF